MKHLALIAVLFCGGLAFSQNESHSEKEKKYQRYENGELIEDKYYLERDGQRIAGQDFEMPEMDVKMAEVQARMNSMQRDMDTRMQAMQVKMEGQFKEIQERSRKIQAEIQRKILEMRGNMLNSAPMEVNPSSLNAFNFPIFGA